MAPGLPVTDIYTGYLDRTDCCVCGVQFSMPRNMLAKRREDGKDFYCPNGHCLHFTETTVDKLKKELARAQEEVAQEKRNTEFQRCERTRVEKSLIGTKAALTRVKNRVGNGVCPCCQRNFGNLQQHMKTKHPEYATEPAENDVNLKDKDALDKLSYKELHRYAVENKVKIRSPQQGRPSRATITQCILREKDTREGA
jgi:hypothetical protein